MSDEFKLIRSEGRGDIKFELNNIERLRIAEDGEFYVEGRRVTKDVQIYDAICDFFGSSGHLKPDHKITYDDLGLIISTAKGRYAHMTLPMMISKKEASYFVPAQVLLIEAVVMYLTGKGLLKADVRLDYDHRK